MAKRTNRSLRQRQVAVIGYALRVPGAKDREAFWRLLAEGRCAVTQVPPDRFPVGAFYHPKAGPEIPGRSYTFAAGILDDIWGFDPAVFGISPREAAQMDPQQRHLLQVVYEAIEHAGLRPSSLAGSRTGVYVGASASDYATRFMFDPSAVDIHMMTGNTLSIISNRISYCFDLRGPSFTVDTACSSSLVAMHVALEAIREGKIDTAIVGGVNLLLSPFSFVGFARASMLSPAGLCKAFDASGDGYVRSEGALAIVLRAADLADRNGDRVHAVVVGSGINEDGRTAGLSLPSQDAQAALLEEVYGSFGISPRDLSFVEAHGTGTRVGDPAEAGALGKVLGQCRPATLPIGSVKTNIGHLEPASGLAGVVKAIMALEHELLPPSLHFKDPNPDIRFEELNIEVVTQPTKLPKKRGPRYAGVNSFGFGGSNAHIVLREPDKKRAARTLVEDNEAAPLILSSYGVESLKALAERYVNRLPTDDRPGAAEICNAAAHTRDLLPERLVVAGSDKRATLLAHCVGTPTPSVWRGKALGTDLDVAFVFAGNGSQWAGMGLAAYQANPAFRDALNRFDSTFVGIAGWSAIDALQSSDLAVDIRRASRAQPLLLALQVATVEALAVHGLVPTLALGHSVGEIAAAWCTGALDPETAIRVVLARSRFQEITRHQGGMAAVLVSASEIQLLLKRHTFEGLEIAAVNSTRSVTVAGPTAALDAFVKYAEQERWGVRRLDLDYPFHCALVDPIEDKLLESLEGIKPSATRIPLISTVTGEEIAGDSLYGDYWWRNVRQPVLFEAGMHSACRHGVRIFVEISPRPILGGYLNDALRRQGIEGAVIDTLGRDAKEPNDDIVATVARTLVAGGRVDLGRFVGTPVYPAVELPNYAWHQQHAGFPTTSDAFKVYSAYPHPLLGASVRAGTREWTSSIDPYLFPWLGDHRVENTAVFPAAGFIEIALAAGREILGDGTVEVRDLEILQPLVFDGMQSFEVMTRASHDTGVLEILSRPRSGENEWSLHVRASVATSPVPDMSAERLSGQAIDVFDSARLYPLTRRRGLTYGPAFQKVASVEVVDDRRARVSFTSAPPVAERMLLDPTILDSAFHVLFALAETDETVAPDDRFLPVRMGSLRMFRPGVPVAQGEVRATLVTPRSRVGDILLFDDAGNVVAQLQQVRFRTVPRTTVETKDSLTYRTGFIRLHQAGQPSAASTVCVNGAAATLARTARAMDVAEEVRDVSLVLDIGTRAASYAAIRDVMGDAAAVSVTELIASGRVSMASWPLLARLLLDLSEAGLAFEADQEWKLKESPEFPTIAELIDVLMTRYPAWIAEATCLARLPELLPRLLREGLGTNSAIGQAVLEHLEIDSPAARRLTSVVLGTARDIIARWPKDTPLSVLIVGAANLPLATKLAPAVASLHGRIVVTDMDEERLQVAKLGLSDITSGQPHVAEWNEAVDAAAGGYDLVLCAGTLHRVAVAPAKLDFLVQAMRQGGVLVAAEPAPNLFSDVVYGQASGWWIGSINPDFPVGSILQERDWRYALESAGLNTATVQAFDGESSAGLLVSGIAGRTASAQAARVIDTRSMVIVADSTGDCHVLADLLQLRFTGTGRVTPLRSSESTSIMRGKRRVRVVDLNEAASATDAIADLGADGPVTDVIFIAADRGESTDPVEALARKSIAMANLAQAIAASEGARLWVVCSGALDGVVDGRAPHPTQTGLWAAARVIQNEFPGIEVRCLDVDPMLASDVAASRMYETIAHVPLEREVRLTATGCAALRVLRGGVFGDAAESCAGGQASRRLAINRSGQGDGFSWRSVPRRAPQPNEVEIQVEATGLNFRDVMWSLGLLPDEALENGFTGPTIGMECAGIVSAVGTSVSDLAVGDRVVAFAADAFATHVTVGAQTVARIPGGISTISAATLPVAFLTAYYALVHLARLEAGETVLIHGGAGGVGLAALQIAKLRGGIVIATAGSADRRTLLRHLGADHVLDSRSLAFVDDVARITGGVGVDVVLNSLAAEAMERSVDCLKPFGRFLELGKRDFYANRHLGLRPFRNNLSYFGIDADQLLAAQGATVGRLFSELMALFSRGELVPLPYRVFEAEDAAKAFRLMQRSGHIGKIIIEPPKLEPSAVVTQPFVVNPRSRYLIVGGLGGFGLATAQWLVAKGASYLTLMSRSARPTEAGKATLASLERGGVRVDLVAIDVADKGALDKYLTSIEGDDVPLKGVFHTAMVIDDALAKDLDRSRFEAVLRPKVAGARNLDQLTRRFDLDCFVLFSSATVLVGNPGQANYVAANAYLEGLAQCRRSEGLPALAISWGAIADVGYLAQNAGVNHALAQRLGNASLTSSEALEGLDALLAQNHRDVRGAAIGYARIDWSLVRKELAISHTPLFEDIRLADVATDGSSMGAEELLRTLRELPDAEVAEKLADIVVSTIARTLRISTSAVDRNRALSEFGMDSLMMLELRTAMEEELGIEITLMSLTSSLTVSDVAKRLTTMLRNREKSLISSQMSALAQAHLSTFDTASEGEIAATAAAVSKHAKAVDGVL